MLALYFFLSPLSALLFAAFIALIQSRFSQDNLDID